MKFRRKQAPELPDEGVHPAMIIAVRDIGVIKTKKWGPKDMVAVTFRVDQKGRDGKPLTVVQNYTNLLSPKSNLTKLLRTVDVVVADDGDDDESSLLIGKTLFVTIQHAPGRNKNTTHARVVNFARTRRQQAYEVVETQEVA